MEGSAARLGENVGREAEVVDEQVEGATVPTGYVGAAPTGFSGTHSGERRRKIGFSLIFNGKSRLELA